MVENKTAPLMTKIVLLLSANWVIMAGAALSPAMPAMMAAYASLTNADVWVPMILTFPALFIALGGPIAGYLADKLGRKWILLLSSLLAGLSGAAGYFLVGFGPLLISRALLGLGIAGATTATNALIADTFEGQERAKFMGLYTAFGGLGGVIFLPLGGMIADINWRLSFLLYLPALVLFVLGIFSVQESKVIPSDHALTGRATLKLNPTLFSIFITAFLFQFSFLTLPIYFAPFLQFLMGLSSYHIGLMGAVGAIFSFLGGIVYDSISKRLNFRNMNLLALISVSIGFIVLGFAKSIILIIISQIILGFWAGVVLSNLPTWLVSLVRIEVRGRASGIYVTMMFIGQILTALIFAPIIRISGFHMAYFVSAGIMILVGLVGFIAQKDKGHLKEKGLM
ncbi:MAG: MFS transporter [Anaerolineales bacterium]